MTLPIPLICLRNGSPTAGTGTGFLVRKGSEYWLTTSVHIVSGLVNTPCDMAYFTNSHFHVVGNGLNLSFHGNGQQRFTVVSDPSDGMLYDAVALKLNPLEVAALAAYGAHDLRGIVQAEPGQTITMTGFPGLGLEVIPSQTLTASVTRVHGVSVTISKAGKPGLSGSAALSSTGLVGIVQGATLSPDEGLITGLQILKDYLFS